MALQAPSDMRHVPLRTAELPRAIGFAREDAEVTYHFRRILADSGIVSPVVVGGSVGVAIIGELLGDALDRHSALRVTGAGLDEADEVRAVAAETQADGIVGIGGGRTLDVAKFAAFLAGLPLIVVPTQASHDGICSPVAVLRDGDGRLASYGSRPPTGIVVAVHVIAAAPRRSLVAGIADVVVNPLAVRDWEWARETHQEPFDDFAALLARSAADLVIARRHLFRPARPFDEEDVENVVRALVLSGMAMTLAGSSRPCSGSEHLVSHAIDALGVGDGLHGEQVALGARIGASLFPDAASPLVLDVLERIGAATTPDDLGIAPEDAIEAVRLARRIRPGRHSKLVSRLETQESAMIDDARRIWRI